MTKEPIHQYAATIWPMSDHGAQLTEIEMLFVFTEGGKPVYPEKNPWSKGENELTNSTHMKHMVRKLNQAPKQREASTLTTRPPLLPEYLPNKFRWSNLLHDNVSRVSVGSETNMCLVSCDGERASNSLDEQFLQMEITSSNVAGSIDKETKIEGNWAVFEWEWCWKKTTNMIFRKCFLHYG